MTASILHTNTLTGWVSFDVTADVTTFLAGTANYGWLLKKTDETQSGWVEYTSQEGALDQAPRLVLVFETADDTTPPTLQITAPSDAFVLNDPTPALAVTYADADSGVDLSSLRILLDGDALIATCTIGAASATCEAPPLTEGPHTVAAEIRDQAGNLATASRNFTLLLGAECTPGTVVACYDGPPGTQGVGQCTAGTRTCQADGTFGACVGQVLPQPDLSGNGLDEDCDGSAAEAPILSAIGNQTVQLGTTLTLQLSATDANGDALIYTATTATPAPDGSTYAGFREAILLIGGVTNVVERPFFLPRIAGESLTVVDPTTTTVVTNPTLGITLTVPPHTAKNPDGTDFTGALSISEVPEGLAPAPLPSTLHPGLLIAIQPVGVTFATPAPISFPNTDSLTPGSEVDLWSLDPNSGTFAVVGTGLVRADGSGVDTIAGGVRATDWHFILPPVGDPGDDGGPNDSINGPGGPCRVPSGSATAVCSGDLTVDHTLVRYRSLGQPRALRLVYHSTSADPQPIVKATTTIPLRAAVPATTSTQLSIAGVDHGVERFTETTGLNENIDEQMRQVVQFDAQAFPTGRYPYRLTLTNHYPQSWVASILAGHVLVRNDLASPVGAGWTLDGVGRLQVQADRSVLVVEGDGALRVFRPNEVDLVFADFTAIDNFFLNGAAAQMNNPVPFNGRNVLRLTSGPGQEGSAFVTLPLELAEASVFTTAFQFQITDSDGVSDNDGPGADGLAFVIATDPQSLGGGGSGLGYSGITPSVAVEFDTFAFSVGSGNHVGINLNGSTTSVVEQHIGTRLNNGAVWYVWVDYDGPTSQLEVRVADTAERPLAPTLSATVNLPALLGGAPAYLGFTSGTGAGFGTHDIRAWEVHLLSVPGQSQTFLSPTADFSTLSQHSDGSFTRTLKDGTQIHFDADGLQTAVVDRHGNTPPMPTICYRTLFLMRFEMDI